MDLPQFRGKIQAPRQTNSKSSTSTVPVLLEKAAGRICLPEQIQESDDVIHAVVVVGLGSDVGRRHAYDFPIPLKVSKAVDLAEEYTVNSQSGCTPLEYAGPMREAASQSGE